MELILNKKCVFLKGNTYSFVGGRIIVQQEKISTAELIWTNPLNALQEAIHLLLYKILNLLFFPLVRILCALCLESRKKIINMVLMRDLWKISFFGRRYVLPTHSELCRFVSG